MILGNQWINSVEGAEEVFDNANAKEMRNQLMAQLLAMKFNIAYFGIGGYYIDSWGMALDELVGEADTMLRDDPEPPREELEEMKNILNYINNLHYIKYYSDDSLSSYSGEPTELLSEPTEPTPPTEETPAE